MTNENVVKLLSRKEVEKRLGVSRSTLQRWSRSSYLPCRYIGGRAKYDEETVAIIESGRKNY